MKINTNSIGNYSPRIMRTVNNSPKVQNNFKNINSTSTKSSNDLSVEEKKYFMDKYPGNKKEIMDYHFYSRNGQMSGVKIGSLFDRRG